MRQRRGDRGFTLIELMITVAIVAVLAAIAVPAFTGESRKSKAGSEVPTVFSDIRVRLDQYHQEMGTYPASLVEANLYPATQSTTKQTFTPPTTWDVLKLRLSGSESVYCGYSWVTNKGGTVGTIGTSFAFVAPANDWYYIVAKCNMDNNTTTDSTYFTSSLDVSVQSKNKGY